MYNTAIRQKSKIWSVYGYLYKYSQNSYCIPIFFNATIQFRMQAILGVQKNIGSLICGGGGGGARGSYLASGLYVIDIYIYISRIA